MSVRLSAEMAASLTSTVWLSDALSPDPTRFHQPCFFNCKKPKVCRVYFKGLRCFRNEKIRLCKVMLPHFVLTGQIWQILTLVSCCCSSQQAEGVIRSHAHPKAFVQLRKRNFFPYYPPIFSLEKAVHGMPTVAWLLKAACLPLWSCQLSGLAILLRHELYQLSSYLNMSIPTQKT